MKEEKRKKENEETTSESNHSFLFLKHCDEIWTSNVVLTEFQTKLKIGHNSVIAIRSQNGIEMRLELLVYRKLVPC